MMANLEHCYGSVCMLSVSVVWSLDMKLGL